MDALEFAIQTELDGVKYYSNQAELHKDSALFRVFELLAADERQHAVILRRIVGETPEELTDSETLAKVKNIFMGINDFKNEIRPTPTQLDAYRMACEMEKKSIRQYTILSGRAASEKDKVVYQYLLHEEEKHLAIMDELVLRISRPEEWVESAEFGEREEY